MISGYLVGDAEVVQRLDALGPKLRDEMKVGIGRAVLKLTNMVKRDKLSGQVLMPRTDVLRRSIGYALSDEGSKVAGIVSTNVKYARAHEYGFKGTVSVRESMRTIKQAFGRPIAPVTVTVRAHSMKMNLPERSFLRSALADLEASGAIRAELEAAITRATQG
jgi:phage gpG-like protein